jgi:hypothetical protein
MSMISPIEVRLERLEAQHRQDQKRLHKQQQQLQRLQQEQERVKHLLFEPTTSNAPFQRLGGP